MSSPKVKRCCLQEPDFICVYEKNEIVVVCKEDIKKIEYKTGIVHLIDYHSDKKLDQEVFFNEL